MFLRILLLAALAWPAIGSAASAVATLTIADGELLLIRDAARHRPAEGALLLPQDIVETGPQTGLARLEFNDGAIVDLGPATRVLLAPRWGGAREARPQRLYLLQGWAKLTAPGGAAQTAPLASARLDVVELTLRAVAHVAAAEAAVFAESGDLTLVERDAGRAAPRLRLKGGEFYARSGDAKATITARPVAAFIERVPRSFLDILPARAARLKGRNPEPKPLGPVAYADVQAWIDAEPALRRGFVSRWRAMARQPEFRAGLVAGLAAHPEWDPVLYPEKYLPKPGVAASAAAAPSPPPR